MHPAATRTSQVPFFSLRQPGTPGLQCENIFVYANNIYMSIFVLVHFDEHNRKSKQQRKQYDGPHLSSRSRGWVGECRGREWREWHPPLDPINDWRNGTNKNTTRKKDCRASNRRASTPRRENRKRGKAESDSSSSLLGPTLASPLFLPLFPRLPRWPHVSAESLAAHTEKKGKKVRTATCASGDEPTHTHSCTWFMHKE